MLDVLIEFMSMHGKIAVRSDQIIGVGKVDMERARLMAAIPDPERAEKERQAAQIGVELPSPMEIQEAKVKRGFSCALRTTLGVIDLSEPYEEVLAKIGVGWTEAQDNLEKLHQTCKETSK